MGFKEVKYRLETNYYAKDYDNKACEFSDPIFTLEDGLRKYNNAISSERCIDNKEMPVRAHLWEYHYDVSGVFAPITIAKNY